MPIDPLSAQQIEVIRGPATLRCGSQAIGGVVNVDNNRIPTFDPAARLRRRSRKARVDHASTTASKARCCSTPARAISPSTPTPSAARGRGLPHPELSLSVSARSARRWSTAGSRTRALRADGQSVGGSYMFDGGFVGVAVSQFASFYRIPGIEATETGTRIDAQPDQGDQQGRVSAAARRRSTRCGSGRAPPTTSMTSSPTRTASTASSRPSPTRRRKAASRSSSCRSTCASPRSPPRSACRRRIRSYGRRPARRRPVRSEHDAQHRRLHLQRVQVQRHG